MQNNIEPAVSEQLDDSQIEPTEIDNNLIDCAKALGVAFDDLSTLRIALTHRSYSAEHKEYKNYERLEFLGDAVLDLIITDILFKENTTMPEGEMAKARSAVVNEDTLFEVAREIGLGSFIYFGVGEAKSGGSDKPSILSDTLEAVIASIYLECGYERAKEFVTLHWFDRTKQSANNPGIKDYKTRFQEALIKYNNTKPRYVTEAIGPEHTRIFNSCVYSGREILGKGTGRSKKLAEQDAAHQALEYIEGFNPTNNSD